jgi:hypothetical protein
MKGQGSRANDTSLADILDRVVERVAAKKQASFVDLVAAAGLDPGRDFVGASLAKLDLSGEDLRGFDFTNADLSDADFSRANVAGVSFRGANISGAIGLVLPPEAPTRESPAVPAVKPELQTVKRMVLRGDAIPENWVPFVTQLHIGHTGIRLRDLSPIAGLVALKSLRFPQSRVRDLAPIAGLVELERLNCAVAPDFWTAG